MRREKLKVHGWDVTLLTNQLSSKAQIDLLGKTVKVKVVEASTTYLKGELAASCG